MSDNPTMIERVARAIDDSLVQRAGFPEPPTQSDYLDAARAAIEELREPSEAMLKAMDGAIDLMPEEPEHFRPAYIAAINAILTEGGVDGLVPN